MGHSWLFRRLGIVRVSHEVLFSLSVGFVVANGLNTRLGTIGGCVDDLLGISRSSREADLGKELAFLVLMFLLAQSFLLLLMYVRLAPGYWSAFVLGPLAGMVILWGPPFSCLYSVGESSNWPPVEALRYQLGLVPLVLVLVLFARRNSIPIWALASPLLLDYYFFGDNLWMFSVFALPVALVLVYLTRRIRVANWSVFVPLLGHYCFWLPYFDGQMWNGINPGTIPATRLGLLVWPASGLIWLLYVIVLHQSECKSDTIRGQA